MIEIIVNTEEVERQLTFFQKDQYPWALKKTLDGLASDSRDKVQVRTRDEFNLNTEFVPKGVWWNVAKKNEITSIGFTSSAVFTAPRISGFMPIHEVGGTRTAQTARNISIPSPGLEKLSFRTGRGAVKLRYKPKTMLKQWNATNRKLVEGDGDPEAGLNVDRSAKSRKRHAFLVYGKGGIPLIVRRKTKKRYPLEVLYKFTTQAKYESRWDFEPIIRKHVADNFRSEFQRQLTAAMAIKR